MSAGVAFGAAVSALAGATVHPYEAALVDKLRGRDGTVLDFAAGHALQRAGGVGWLRPIGDAVTFGRASAGGRWPAEGPYEMVGAGALRLDHDPVTREPLGVLIEGAHSPVTSGTAAFDAAGAAWYNAFGASNVTEVTSAFVGGVAGLHTSAGGEPSRYQSRTVVAGQNYLIETIFEVTGTPPATSHFGLYAGSWLGLIAYRWATGVATVAVGSVSGLLVEQLGTGPNGGQMVRVSGVINTGTATSVTHYIYPCGSSGSVAGTSCVVHYACLSPVTGTASPTPSPLIVPVGATQARAADRLSRALSTDPAVDGVTVAIRARTPKNIEAARVLYTIAQSSLGNRIAIYAQNSSWYFSYSKGGALPMLLNMPATPGQDVRIVFSATPSGIFKWSINGGPVVTADRTLYPLPIGLMLTEYIGSYPASTEYNSTIACVARWRGTPLSDADLQGLLV